MSYFFLTADLVNFIDKKATEVSGLLFLSYDGGKRPFWQVFLGKPKTYRYPFAALLWKDQFASLILYDENWSEYRVIDEDFPVNPSTEVRNAISFGEKTPNALDECLKKDRAFTLLQNSISNGRKPDDIKYRFVR